MNLFEIEPREETTETCRTCKHRQRWECNSKIFQYCGVRKSNRTQNGLRKIKCKDKACLLYLKSTLCSVLVAVVLLSCNFKKREVKTKQEIIVAKTIEYNNRDTKYHIAYKSGSSDYFDYGLYVKYDIGDTICFERGSWIWYVVDCK